MHVYTLYCGTCLIRQKVCVGIAGCWITHYEKHWKKIIWDRKNYGIQQKTSQVLHYTVGIVNLYIFYYFN